MITITRTPDILQKEQLRYQIPYSGQTLGEVLPSDFDPETGLIEVDSKVVECLDYPVSDGDHIVLVDLPGGGNFGKAFKNFALAGLTLPFAPVSLRFFQRGLSAFSSSVANLLQKRPTPENDIEKDQQSPTRRFGGQQNTIGPGSPIPIVYGTVRMGGHIIESYSGPWFEQSSEPGEVVTIGETEFQHDVAQRLNTRVGVCHGPIEDISSIEVDGNPIANIDGAWYETVLGTPHQKSLSGFDETKTNTKQTPQTVSVSGGAITEQTEANVITAEVELLFTGGLYEVDASGNIIERSISVTLEYRQDGGAWRTPFSSVSIAAAKRGPFSVWFRYPVFQDGEGIYDIRVTRNTADNSDPDIQDTFRFEQLVEVPGGNRSHPGIAQFGVRQVAQTAQAVPRRYTALVQGFNDIRIYTDTSTYTTGWTDNPAWCCLHWITSKRFGLGHFYDYTDVDMQSFIDWANHCDTLVADGRGGTEKRCTFNFAFDSLTSGGDMLQIFTSGQDAFLVETGGRWKVVLDTTDSAVMTFSEGSYRKDSLQYIYTGSAERASRIQGTFLNEENEYRRDTFIQEDQNISPTEHHIDLQVNLFGVTRPGQMSRQLVKALNKNRLSTAQCSFDAGIAAINMEVGDLFNLGSKTFSSKIIATGRLLRVADDWLSIVIDENVTLASGTSYEITVLHEDNNEVSTLTVTGVLDQVETNRLSVSLADWKGDLKPGLVYSLGETSESFKTFRCTSITMNDDLTRRITGELYDAAIYTAAIVSNPSVTVLGAIDPEIVPAAVSGPLTASERQPQDSATNTRNVIDVAWAPPTVDVANPATDVAISHYDVFWRENTGSRWRAAGTTKDTTFTIVDSVAGSTTYAIAVVAVSMFGKRLPLDQASTTTVAIS